jgi:hypothetical protein
MAAIVYVLLLRALSLLLVKDKPVKGKTDK